MVNLDFLRKKKDAVGKFGNDLTATRTVMVICEDISMVNGRLEAKLKAMQFNTQSVSASLAKGDTLTLHYTITMGTDFRPPSSSEDWR